MGLLSTVFGPLLAPHTSPYQNICVQSNNTLCQTLSFRTISKKQSLFKSVTRLNPVLQPILTVTFHYNNHSNKKYWLFGGWAKNRLGLCSSSTKNWTKIPSRELLSPQNRYIGPHLPLWHIKVNGQSYIFCHRVFLI